MKMNEARHIAKLSKVTNNATDKNINQIGGVNAVSTGSVAPLDNPVSKTNTMNVPKGKKTTRVAKTSQ